jgi:ADP-dependent NAD(P)H-hydrate dehydratase / NAD(P)H-hydrate epimerase
MNIYNRGQIKAWDDYTIQHEPISSTELMERASLKVFNWLVIKFPIKKSFVVFCGTGNNGGDGLAVARMLKEQHFEVMVFLFNQGSMSEDCRQNLDRLEKTNCKLLPINSFEDVAGIENDAILIDALYGTGLSRPLEGAGAALIDFINTLPNTIVSIDMPSGLPADTIIANAHAVRADFTLTFQAPKFSFFLPEHEVFTGVWHVLDIGLNPEFEHTAFTSYQFCNREFIRNITPSSRPIHSHKGLYGHAILHGGCNGMMGALIMGLRACLRSGVGLVTAAPPDDLVHIVQTAVPEAMCGVSAQWMQHAWYHRKTAVGVGMGWQQDDFHGKLLQWLISNVTAPLLLDASALNILAYNPEWLLLRPQGAMTILTPHAGEFVRLAGPVQNSIHQLERAKELASAHNVIIVLKGAYTRIITPRGLVYFNSTGNPGMAKGGSGDVLAGLIAGLLAQGIPPVNACLLGVFVHGLAGDLAAEEKTETAITAGDMIEFLPQAWKHATSWD